jgi:hypothetical protein
VGQVQRRRHPGDAAADDQRSRDNLTLRLLLRLQQASLGHPHPDEPFGLLRGSLPSPAVNPRTVLSDVDEFKEVAIQPRLLAGVLEQPLVSPGGAGGDDHPVEMVLADTLLEGGQPFLGATVQVILGVSHVTRVSSNARSLLSNQ